MQYLLDSAAAKSSVAVSVPDEFTLVTHAIRASLTRDAGSALPASYQRIFDASRALICFVQRGEGIFERLRIELEKSISTLANLSLRAPLVDVPVSWIAEDRKSVV